MRTTDKLEFTEYTLQYRYDQVHSQPGQGKVEWRDATGYNNPTSTYNHLSQVRAQISRTRRHEGRHYTGMEFRVLARKVKRTEWSEVLLDA